VTARVFAQLTPRRAHHAGCYLHILFWYRILPKRRHTAFSALNCLCRLVKCSWGYFAVQIEK
jgi:hypothetical protein